LPIRVKKSNIGGLILLARGSRQWMQPKSGDASDGGEILIQTEETCLVLKSYRSDQGVDGCQTDAFRPGQTGNRGCLTVGEKTTRLQHFPQGKIALDAIDNLFIKNRCMNPQKKPTCKTGTWGTRQPTPNTNIQIPIQNLLQKILEQRFAEAFLLVWCELAAGRGEIKNVDGGLAFCIDQGDVDIAILMRER
jgi:hypothetical protein